MPSPDTPPFAHATEPAPNRPTGTVTFLFTDVEGSTRLWEAHPAWMATAHRQQEQILRAAIAAHGGQVRQQIGDALQAAFPTAPQALAAAVAAQRELSAVSKQQSADDEGSGIGDRESGDHATRNTQRALRVRMALATGEADEAALLRRLDALLPAGNGGQILLPVATAAAVRDRLPAGVWLRDLGARQLKGQATPAHVWQVVVPDVGDQFRPLRLSPGRPHNLPRQLTSFIGREREAADVAARLRQPATRLVTLTGPGGTGKTRLSLQVAADLLDEYADGVWFVDLSALTDPALVPGTIAAVLGVKEQGATPLVQTLATYLADKQLLLVLDNCEQLLPAGPTVATLLAAPGLRGLATSRVPLALPAEQRYAVPPLRLPDAALLPAAHVARFEAVRLFVDRAQARAPGFALDLAGVAAIAAICQAVDGLPLAIELAAARVAELGLAGVQAGLADRLGLLVGRLRGRSARQQTLRGAIAWSYNLLSARQQQLFRRLAVFQGGRTLEALDAVCNHDGALPLDVLDGVQALVDQSLLQQRTGHDGEPRFWLLETIHEYAREQLVASGEEGALRAAHLAYFTALAEQAVPELRGPAQTTWLARLEDEHDNLRAALAWARTPGAGAAAAAQGLRLAGALWRFWEMRGYYGEERLLLTAALETAALAPAATRALALHGAGTLAFRQGDYAAARALLAQALTLWRQLGDRQGLGSSLNNLGIVAYFQGDYAAARAQYEESVALARELGDRSGVGLSLNNLGIVASVQGEYGAARALFEESLALARELGDRSGVGMSLSNLGGVALAQGDTAAARALFEESLALARELGDRSGVGLSLSCLGLVASQQEDYAAARGFFAQSLALRQEIGAQEGIAAALAGLGGLLVAGAAGAPERAARVLGAAAALLHSLGAFFDPLDRLPYERAVAAARAALGEAAFAAAWAAGQALSLADAIALALQEDPPLEAPPP